MKAINNYLKRLHERIKLNKRTFILYTILRIMVLVALVRSIMIHNYEGAAVCLLTLVLFILPSFLEFSLQVEIPGLFQGIIYCFIFAAMILGELDNYYTKIPIWDTALHTLNGFLFAAVVFCIFGYLYLRFGSEKKVAASVVEGLRIQPVSEPSKEKDDTTNSVQT